MSLLENRRLLDILPSCIEPYDPISLGNASYELRLGDEYFTTNTEDGGKLLIEEGKQIIIKPGQLALLITKEVITIPSNLIAFISIKASIKFCGLVNVSGFHVDPGFHGKLKFSVYNAGSNDIVLDEGQRLFPIWFLELTADLSPDNKYNGTHQNQKSITSEDVRRIQGKIMSPNVLKDMIQELEKDITEVNTKRTIILTIAGSVLLLCVSIFVNTLLNNSNFQFLQKQAQFETKFDKLSNDISSQSNSVIDVQRKLNELDKRIDNIQTNSNLGNK